MKSTGTITLSLVSAFLLSVSSLFIPSATAQQLDAPDRIESFPAGPWPLGLAFDGANIWITNFTLDHGTVTKLRASDGVILGTIPLGTDPAWEAFDGENVWVTMPNEGKVIKLRASDGAILGAFNVGVSPQRVIFDGATVPSHWPSLARNLATVLEKAFVTQMCAPSKASPNTPEPAGKVPRTVPSLARSLVTVSLPKLVVPGLAAASPSGGTSFCSSTIVRAPRLFSFF